jgi:hypothetical protein
LDKAFQNTKSKPCYGYDRVPMRVLKDAYVILKPTLLGLFGKIEKEGKIPQKWKISRVVPLFKKGERTNATNYRPISNVCSLAKLMERMILLNLEEMAEESNVNLTGKNQFGFKKNTSTSTLALVLQEKIARFLDNNEEIGVASLDMSAAFDLVDVELLTKRMHVLGIPKNIVNLISEWLTDRSAIIEVGLSTSNRFEVKKGTVQGSVMGPVLFSLYIRPLLKILPILQFADDGYIWRGGKDWKENIERDLALAHDWLTKSGMVINENKTEFTYFTNKKNKNENIQMNGQEIKSRRTMKVLGINFDNNMSWTTQTDKAIKKVHMISSTMKYLRKYFEGDELLKVLKNQLFSSVYYGAEVWLIPTIHKSIKRRLLSASAGLVRATYGLFGWPISNQDLHTMGGLPTPEDWGHYLTTRTLHKILNTNEPAVLYNALLRQTVTERRNGKMYFIETNKKRVGVNSFQNRCKFVSHRMGTLNWMVPWSSIKNIVKKEFF